MASFVILLTARTARIACSDRQTDRQTDTHTRDNYCNPLCNTRRGLIIQLAVNLEVTSISILVSFLLVETVVRGYHVYQVLWELCVGETFIALHESGNGHDRHAMAIYRDSDTGVIVGHLPR